MDQAHAFRLGRAIGHPRGDLARAGFVGRAPCSRARTVFTMASRATTEGDWDKLVGGFGERWVANSLAFKLYACAP